MDEPRIMKLVKPDISSPLKKRDSYLNVKEDDMILVTIDIVEDCKIETDTGIKDGVKISCREVITKSFINKDKEKEYDYIPTEEIKLKESYSTSSFYLLKDFKTASHWPKEGIFYWVWKASDGLRWEEA